MSGDLISRSALLQTLKYTKAITEDENGETRQLIVIDINKVIEYVEKMPNAYNLDKVVEQLEDKVEHCLEMRDWRGQSELEDAIEIVKAGGVK